MANTSFCDTFLTILKSFLQISKIVEMNLSASQERQQMEKKKLKWRVDSSPSANTVVRGGIVDPTELVIELGSMEIRTFVLNFNNTYSHSFHG